MSQFESNVAMDSAELDMSELSQVDAGIGPLVLLAVYGACFAAGLVVGYATKPEKKENK